MNKPKCDVCGYEHPKLIEWEGKWYCPCPGSCRKRKQRAHWRSQARSARHGILWYEKDVI